MPTMNDVPNVPRQPSAERKKIIKKHIVSKDIDEIAKMCGVNEKTIDRDISKMRGSGEWTEWLELFLLKLYASDDVSDDAKLRSVTMLYGKTMVQKTEVSGSTSTELKVVFDKSMDDHGEPSNPVQTP